jgi:hypothetical protein
MTGFGKEVPHFATEIDGRVWRKRVGDKRGISF